MVPQEESVDPGRPMLAGIFSGIVVGFSVPLQFPESCCTILLCPLKELPEGTLQSGWNPTFPQNHRRMSKSPAQFFFS